MIVRSLRLHGALLAGYLLLAIVHTYPLVGRIGTHLPGQGLGDNVSFVWNGWWMREALSSSSADFFARAPIEAPLFPSLVLHTHSALAAFLGATLLASLSPVAAQNILLIVSVALNGMAAYALAWTVSRARGPSILAGTLFVVAPFVTARLMSHYNLVMVWPLAFACAAFVRWWRAPTLESAALMAVSAGLIPYADYYYAVFFGMFAVAYVASEMSKATVEVTPSARSRTSLLLAALAAIAYLTGLAIAGAPSREWHIGSMTVSVSTPTNALTLGWLLTLAAIAARWRPRVRVTRRSDTRIPPARSVFVALAAFGAMVAPLVLPVASSLSSGDYVTQSSSLKSSPRGIDLATAVLGPPFNGLVGPFVRRAYERLGLDVMEASAWIGLGLVLLLVISVRGADSTREFRRWIGIVTLFVIWALGPFLTVLAVNTGILLPQALMRIMPIVNNARIPGRGMVMVALCALVVLSLALSKRSRPLPMRAVSLLAGLAVVESLAAPLPLAAVPAVGVYADIVTRDESGAVLPIPFGVRDGFGEKGLLEHDSLFGQTVHRRPLVGGFLARLPPRVWSWYEETEPYRTLLELSAGGMSKAPPSCEQVIAGLREASVAFVVVYPAHLSAALAEFVDRLPLQRIAQDDHRVLFAVDATRPEPCDHAAR